jgi:cobalt/nickel transport system permease protein
MIRPLDLRLRLVAAFILVLAVSQLDALPTSAGALLLAAAATAVIGPHKGWRRLLHVEAFVLLLFLSLPFTVPGEPLFEMGPLVASVEGLSRGALVACKVSASVLVILVLLAGIEPDRLGGALRSLRMPERMVRLFVLTTRYLGLFREEARRLHEAMRARGFRPRSSLHTWRSYGNLIGMLLVRSLDRARRVEEAMLCRGYAGRFLHAALPRPATSDWAAFTALVCLAATLSVADRLWT